MKFLASASSEADRRATRRSKPPPGSSRARGSESLSMLREVGHPRSSSHAQFLRLALGVHAELVSLVRALRRWHRRLHRCLSAPPNFRIPQSSAHQQRTITGCAGGGGRRRRSRAEPQRSAGGAGYGARRKPSPRARSSRVCHESARTCARRERPEHAIFRRSLSGYN